MYMDSLCRRLYHSQQAAAAFSYMLNGAKQVLQTLCHIGHLAYAKFDQVLHAQRKEFLFFYSNNSQSSPRPGTHLIGLVWTPQGRATLVVR